MSRVYFVYVALLCILSVSVAHASIRTLTASNTITDIGQYITFTATAPAGSTGPYTYNFIVVNTSRPGIEEVNALYTGVSSSTNTFTVDITDAILSTSAQQKYQFGGLEANVIVTDGANTVSNSVYVQFLHLNTPQVTISSTSNTVLDSGQTYTLTLSHIIGGAGPFNTLLYNITGSKPFGSNVLVPSGGSNTLSFTAYSTTPSNVFIFGVNSYDQGTTTPYVLPGIYENTLPGDQPGVAVSPNGNEVYMTEGVNQYVSLDASLEYSDYMNSALPMHDSQEVAFSPSGGLVYITDYTGNNVLVTNAASNTVVNTIPVGTAPLGVAFDPAKGFAYVANTGSNTISVINVSSNAVIKNINVGLMPSNVSFTPNGAFAYVTNTDSNTVSVINTTTSAVVNTITVGCHPADIAINPVYNLAYVTSGYCGTAGINVINLNTDTVVNSMAPGGNPTSVAFSPSGLLAYAGLAQSNGGVQVYDVPGNLLIYTIGGLSGAPIYDIASSPNKGLIYASNCVNGFGCSITAPIAIMVNPALTIPSISSSASTIDEGQSATLTSSWSGGTAPYTITWYTGPSGSTCAQDSANILATYSSLTGTSNALSVSPTTTNSYCAGVTDSATTPSTQLSSNDVVTVNPALGTHGITPIPAITDSGIPIILTESLLYHKGTAPYTFKWYTGPAGNTCAQDSGNLIATYSGISNTLANSVIVNPTTTNSYCAVVTDSSYAGSETAYSPNTVVTVNPILNAISLSPSNPLINQGQSITFTASWTGGTPDYGASLYSSLTSTCNSESTLVEQVIGLTANSVAFSAVTPNSNTYYCAYVTDNTPNSYEIAGEITSGFNGAYPVAISPDGSYAYVANDGSNNVVIINTATNTITRSISSGFSKPEGIAISPKDSYAYVANWNSGNIIIINTATNTVTGAITSAAFASPDGVAFSPDGSYAYVSNYWGTESGGTGNIVIINTATNTIISSIDSGLANPTGLSFSPDGSYAYVVNYEGAVSVINTATNTIANSVPGVCTGFGIAISPSGTYAYTTTGGCNGNDSVTIINTAINTIVGNLNSTVFESSGPYGVAFSPSGKFAYTTNGNNVVIINTYTATTNSINSEATINPALTTPTISPINPTIDSGQSVILTGTWTGGTPDYTAKWYTGPSGNTCTQDSANVLAIYSSITGTSNAISVSPTSTNSYCIGVTDSASAPETQLSSNDLVTVNAQAHSSAGNPYAGGSTGFFGHLPGATTATSSTTSTVSTTTAALVTIPKITASGTALSKLCNDTAGYYLVYPSLNATFHILPASSACFNVTATNATSAYAKQNRSVIEVINYSVSSKNISSSVTIHYSCSINYSNVYPSIFWNGTWQRINPFIVNASACTVEFAVPADPVIGLLISNAITSTATSSVNTTSIATTTITASNANGQQNQDLIWAVLIVIVVMIILFVYSRSRGK